MEIVCQLQNWYITNWEIHVRPIFGIAYFLGTSTIRCLCGWEVKMIAENGCIIVAVCNLCNAISLAANFQTISKLRIKEATAIWIVSGAPITTVSRTVPFSDVCPVMILIYFCKTLVFNEQLQLHCWIFLITSEHRFFFNDFHSTLYHIIVMCLQFPDDAVDFRNNKLIVNFFQTWDPFITQIDIHHISQRNVGHTNTFI